MSPLPSPSATPPPFGAPDHGVDFSDSYSASTSSHFVSRKQAIKGISNRFIFSQFYIYLYLAMAALSLTTVVLSILSDCPTFTFYILEIIVNTAMILEVSIRLVAFGNQFWKSYYNTLDLLVTILCAITILIIFFSGCSAKGEEVFDTFLLVLRNLFQFGRLALVMRKSGKNVFTRPAPIDLSNARTYSLDLDLDDEEAISTERRALGGDREAISRGTLSNYKPKSNQTIKQQQQQQENRPFLLDSDEDD
ncbi:hypothetical protein OIO90_001196 [Microbotryomycetes sp. JL221]|nr:hypothetical protein OIO90_001196 [Microbotryomycetes sp. JL221]